MEIAQQVKKGECILFLGAMASAPSPKGSKFEYANGPPGGAELSRRLAAKCDYPDEDKSNLQRVSLYFEHCPNRSRKDMVQAVINEVAPRGIVPSPALHMLAALPFRIIITTNYDHLFDTALRDAKTRADVRKDPLVRIYGGPEGEAPEPVPLDPSEERPILLKLHGDIDKPDSIVITEEDYIEFIRRMSVSHHHPIHEYIRARMKTWPTLFIGYSLKDYNLRLLFRTLRWNVDKSFIPLSYSVDPSPDNLIVSVWQNGTDKIVSFIVEDLWEFVPLLYKECKGTDYRP